MSPALSQLRVWLSRPWWLIAGLVVLFAVVILRTAWLSEDAYFTFRSVDNWINGHGARWNINERVQVYTHPLWFGLLSLLFFITRDMIVTGFALGFICTAATIYVLIRRLGGSWQATVMALCCLIASKAFIDYSTSGLENPLSHLLLLCFFGMFWADDPEPGRPAERKLLVTALFGGLVVCNRLDLGLLLAPALVYSLWPPRLSWRRVLLIGLGFAPLILWELVSLIYYGFLVPNTAYAKLGSELPSDQVIRQGLAYFANSLRWDPVTLICVAVVSLAQFRYLRERPKHACAALGVLLYLGYVVEIGGDYMSGRFFTAPLVVAVGLLASLRTVTKPVFIVGTATIVGLAFMAPSPTVLSGKDYSYGLESENKIDDERGYRHMYAGLITERETEFLGNSDWYKGGQKHREKAEASGEILVIVSGNAGYMGYAGGPPVHYINPYGITDPLLARLPGRFRAPGHIRRELPRGYRKAAVGKGKLADPDLAAYWKDLSLITRGPIWSRARWAAIWRMNTGANQHLLDAYLREYLDYDEISASGADPVELPAGGVAIIALDGVHNQDLIEVWVESDDIYTVELYHVGERTYRREFGKVRKHKKGRLVRHSLRLPAKVAQTGYDEIRILPERGADGRYRLGQLSLRARARTGS